MKVLLIGKTGQLGAEILKDAPFFDFEVFAYGHEELDITDDTAMEKEVKRHQPDFIVNTAAFNTTAECEKNPLEALRINCVAVRNLARISKEYGAKLVTFSTDYVFDGEKGVSYLEDDPPRPLQMYGISKLAGELAAQNVYAEGTYVIRTCGLYGGKEGSRSKGGNFVLNMLRDAPRSAVVEVSSEQIVSPTSAKDLSLAVLKILQSNAPAGIYHLVNEGQCSWYEFVKEVYRLRGIKREVVPIDRGGFSGGIRRPRFSALENRKARDIGIALPSWQDGLAEYIRFLSAVSSP